MSTVWVDSDRHSNSFYSPAKRPTEPGGASPSHLPLAYSSSLLIELQFSPSNPRSSRYQSSSLFLKFTVGKGT